MVIRNGDIAKDPPLYLQTPCRASAEFSFHIIFCLHCLNVSLGATTRTTKKMVFKFLKGFFFLSELPNYTNRKVHNL